MNKDIAWQRGHPVSLPWTGRPGLHLSPLFTWHMCLTSLNHNNSNVPLAPSKPSRNESKDYNEKKMFAYRKKGYLDHYQKQNWAILNAI